MVVLQKNNSSTPPLSSETKSPETNHKPDTQKFDLSGNLICHDFSNSRLDLISERQEVYKPAEIEILRVSNPPGTAQQARDLLLKGLSKIGYLDKKGLSYFEVSSDEAVMTRFGALTGQIVISGKEPSLAPEDLDLVKYYALGRRDYGSKERIFSLGEQKIDYSLPCDVELQFTVVPGKKSELNGILVIDQSPSALRDYGDYFCQKLDDNHFQQRNTHYLLLEAIRRETIPDRGDVQGAWKAYGNAFQEAFARLGLVITNVTGVIANNSETLKAELDPNTLIKNYSDAVRARLDYLYESVGGQREGVIREDPDALIKRMLEESRQTIKMLTATAREIKDGLKELTPEAILRKIAKLN